MDSAPNSTADEHLEGVLERIRFTSDDGRFVVARMRLDNRDTLTIVGPLAGLLPGERLRVSGVRETTVKFGEQLRVSSAHPVLPQKAEGIQAYLGSGRIPGIGPALAERLVERFGDGTLQVIETEPERLLEVPGIGKKRVAQIQTAVRDSHGLRDSLVYLQGLGISAALASRIYRRYEAGSIAAVRENPYRLAEEVHGIGFLTADRVARGLGFGPGHPARAAAALVHVLRKAGDDGHVYLPRDVLVERTDALLEQDATEPVLQALVDEGRLIDDGGAVYLRVEHADEVEVAERLAVLIDTPVAPLSADLHGFETRTGLTLAPAQRRAIDAAGRSGVMVVTGGPGTGKTTIVRALVDQLRAAGRVLLAAPTGRAARRMAEATGEEAKTLHRLLEYSPVDQSFRRDEQDPLDAAAIVVDEASMIDQWLFLALVRAITPGTRLLLVGDADQLPSVGAGNVLSDLLHSGVVPSVRLIEVFRQAQESDIVRAAHAILTGERPRSSAGDRGEFYVVEARDGAHATALIERLVVERIPARFGLDPIDDVQVLAPMHRGAAGANVLNERLQARLNPHGEPCEKGKRNFRVGDKVMQVRNDYEREVFNGDVGRVAARTADGIAVRFEGRLLNYPVKALDALVLAYACSVHKSQGSEYPAVVLPLLTEAWVMLQRNLLYTGITRGRRLVVVVTQQRALQRAVGNVDGLRRYTGLAQRLGSAC